MSKLVIELDVDTFDRAERHELQGKYGHNFRRLAAYANTLFLGDPGEVLALPDGEKFFADDVAIDLMWIAWRRTEPDAERATLEAMGMDALFEAFTTPKATTGKKPAKKK